MVRLSRLAAFCQLISAARYARAGSPAAMARTIASCSFTDVDSSSSRTLM
jgi:hypothetical protein